jgi:PIN domain nuclease of toxin-antitoxin system
MIGLIEGFRVQRPCPYACFWEITATQFKARCLRLLDEVAETGETQLDSRTTVRAGALDRQNFLGDPADRIIYATATELGVRLISRDADIAAFDPARVLW